MEQRFGHDFSRVQVHSGPAAERSARDVNADAYTAGHNIVFAAGRFAPGTHEGRRLIAHELAHVHQDALGGRPGVWLRRSPCPSCHKPAGTQHVALEDLHNDDVHYLPDEDASEFFTYMRAGLFWGEYHGGKRTQVRSVRHYNYDGSSQIVGYVLDFENPQGSSYPQPVLTIDVYGKELGKMATDRQAIESVISPIDFIGPGLLARPLVGGTRALAGGLAKAAPESARPWPAPGGTGVLGAPDDLGVPRRRYAGGADFSALAAKVRHALRQSRREGGQVLVAAGFDAGGTGGDRGRRQRIRIQPAAGPGHRSFVRRHLERAWTRGARHD